MEDKLELKQPSTHSIREGHPLLGWVTLSYALFCYENESCCFIQSAMCSRNSECCL
jgi:hypothetical protein